MKINERGEMVVDEASLVVVENPENRTWETVNDVRKINAIEK